MQLTRRALSEKTLWFLDVRKSSLFTCGCCFCCWASARCTFAHTKSVTVMSTVTQRLCCHVWVWVRPNAFRLIWEDLVPWWKEIQPSIINARSDRSQVMTLRSTWIVSARWSVRATNVNWCIADAPVRLTKLSSQPEANSYSQCFIV